MTLIDQIKAARRVSVPLVAVQTPDPAATVEAICDATEPDAPKLQWDLVRGLTGINEPGKAAVGLITDATAFNPVATLAGAANLPRESLLFLHLANRLIGEPAVLQAAWNLRDKFKADRRMLVLLARDLMAPLHPDWHHQEKNGYPVLAAKIEPWTPRYSRMMFIQAFQQLKGAQ